jgi:hypothetical protein
MTDRKLAAKPELSPLRRHLLARHGVVGFDLTATEESCTVLHEHDHHPLLGAKHALRDLGIKPEKSEKNQGR